MYYVGSSSSASTRPAAAASSAAATGLSVEVDSSTDWDSKVDSYQDADGRTKSVVDDHRDWDGEIDKYWDPDAKRGNRTASIVDGRRDWDAEVDKYWNPAASPLPEDERKSGAGPAGYELHSDEEDDVSNQTNGPDPDIDSDDEEWDRILNASSSSIPVGNIVKQRELDAFIAKLKDLGVSVVVFDLDRTACREHSGGMLDSEKTDAYIAAAAPDFRLAVPHLLRHRFKLAIASHTDDKCYGSGETRLFHLKNYVAGVDLIKLFLKGVFSETIMRQFYVVAYNPDKHYENAGPNKRPIPPHKVHKNHHITLIAKQFAISDNLSKMVLFDDSKRNVDSALGRNVRAFHVDRACGFRLNDLLERSPAGAQGDDADSDDDDDDDVLG